MKPTSARKQTSSESRSNSSEGKSASSSARTPSIGKSTSAERSERTGESIGSIGRYRLLGRIGEGGMAEVYRAVMTGPEGFERELVLKRILPRLSESGDFKTMFVREAKICAQMLHPNIIQIYEFGQADGGYFIAMESVQGVTLREALNTLRKEERAIPHMIAADVTRQICIGLDYAHTLRGSGGEPLEIVHQDISPTNIMLAFTGTVKILDFGIARAAEFAEEEAKKGLIKGKVSYLSPEQIFVRPFDARADIFALGVVFHEMLTGRRLFQSRNDITKMRELLAAPILPPSAIDAMIPRELDRIVMRSLELDPKNRYQTASDMAADLERTLIAARYASRELSKLLRDLYMAGDEPLVVVDAGDDKENLEQTIAITSTATLPPIEQTHAVRHKEETQIADGRRVARRALAPAVDALARADQGHGRGAGHRRGRRRHRVRRQEIRAEPADAVDAVAAADAGDDKPDARRTAAPAKPTPPPAPAKQVKKRPKKEKGKGHASPSSAAEEAVPVGDETLPPTRQ